MPTQARGFRVSTQYSRQVGYKRIRAVVADDIPDMQTIMIRALEHDGFVHVVGTADNSCHATAVDSGRRPLSCRAWPAVRNSQ